MDIHSFSLAYQAFFPDSFQMGPTPYIEQHGHILQFQMNKRGLNDGIIVQMFRNPLIGPQSSGSLYSFQYCYFSTLYVLEFLAFHLSCCQILGLSNSNSTRLKMKSTIQLDRKRNWDIPLSVQYGRYYLDIFAAAAGQLNLANPQAYHTLPNYFPGRRHDMLLTLLHQAQI